MEQPLLSICIPTYNRSETLEVVLSHYTQNPEFDESVEIVISDNASPDNTEEVCRKFVSQFKNIRYYRNTANIKDANFPLVLGKGNGKYLKLLNDCVYLDEEALKYMKQGIRDHLIDRRQIFFTCDLLYTKNISDFHFCEDLDQYVQRVSTFVTCNNLFGCWHEDWNLITDKLKYAPLQLQQDDWTYQLVAKKNGCILYNRAILSSVNPWRVYRTPYNWFKVHLDNYYSILSPYIENNLVSRKTFKQDTHYLLRHFKDELYAIYVYPRKVWFLTEGTFGYLWKYYKKDPFFYIFMLSLPFPRTKIRIHKIIDCFKDKFQRQ